MYHQMKYLPLFLIALSLKPLYAQDKTFHIGAAYVAPEAQHYQNRVYVTGPVIYLTMFSPPPPANNDSLRFTWLSRHRLTQVRSLNLDLISVPVSPGNVVRDTNMLGNNVVEDICDAALTDNLNVCIQDSGIAARFKGERIMFHPESADDFVRHTPSQDLGSSEDFDQFPISDMKLSRSILAAPQSPNATRIKPGMQTIDSLQIKRKLELSVRRTDTTAGTQGVSGLYYLSVILRKDNDDFPVNPTQNDSSTVFNVDIITRDGTCDSTSPTVIRFPVRESMFFADGSLHSGPFERVLGRIEVLQHGLCIRIDTNTTAPEWSDTTRVHGSVKINQRTDSLLIMTKPFDIRISYGSSDATCLLDAVCLTNPATFGLLYPDSTRKWGQGEHRFQRGMAERRINSILNDEGRRTLFPNLRFITGPEQIEREGTWRTGKLMQRMVQQMSGGQVQTYIATSAWTDSTTTGAMHAGFASGFYYYPMLTEHPRPILATTPAEIAAYYQSLHRNNWAGLDEEAISYRKHAEKRGAYGATTPWIPYVQNHSNLYQTNRPGWWDDVPNREPSAAELRCQCNIALAHGAGGVMYYSFASFPWETSDPFWPDNKATWDGDADRDLDLDMGTLGFIGPDDGLRICDWNGENKCDSVAAYNHDVLKPLGTFMLNHLQWRESKVWNWQNDPSIAGTNGSVARVLSYRQDSYSGIDSSAATYVLISEFDGDDGYRYLFVLNSRTHPEGQRHITVKPTALDGGPEMRVTEVLGLDHDGDIWIVRPIAAPDSTTVANGFTAYYSAGQARLFRLEYIENETMAFSYTDGDPCPNRNIRIEDGATLRLDDSHVVAFGPGYGLYCAGDLVADRTVFRACDLEQTWDGIISRAGGQVSLSQCHIIGGRASVGPASTLMLEKGTRFEAGCDTCAILSALGGLLESQSTIADIPGLGRYASAYYDAMVFLDKDSAQTPSSTPGSTGIVTSGGMVFMKKTRILDVSIGVSSTDIGNVYSYFDPRDAGLNRLRCLWYGLVTTTDGAIDFGLQSLSPDKWGMLNSIHVQYIDPGFHAYNFNATTSIYADSSYWSFGPTQNTWPNPKTFGPCTTLFPLPQDPVPFTGHGAELSKAVAAPPGQWKQAVRQALARKDASTVRDLLLQEITMRGDLLPIPELRDIATVARREKHPSVRDALYLKLLARQDLGSKLLAADLALEDSVFEEAASILDAYSFVATPELQARALARKAVVHPLTRQGGYIRGLAALDSLKSIVGNDSTFTDFIALYPVLYSGLKHGGTQPVPKAGTPNAMNRSLPVGIELWPNYPNPFRDVTSFTFKLGKATHVRLTVHDAMGREVAVLTDADYTRGVYSVVLQSTQLPSGLYFSRFISDEGVIQRKMVLVR